MASAPLLAVVSEFNVLTMGALAHHAFVPAEAGSDLVLPMIRKEHFGLTTTIRVMNGEAITVTAELEVIDPDQVTPIPCGECRVTLAPGTGYGWDPAQMKSLQAPNGFYGVARIRTDGRVVALVEDLSTSGAYDASSYRVPAMCPARAAADSVFCSEQSFLPRADRSDSLVFSHRVLLPIFLRGHVLR
jgi:hypothetical protein